jgi:hypothetical protein
MFEDLNKFTSGLH